MKPYIIEVLEDGVYIEWGERDTLPEAIQCRATLDGLGYQARIVYYVKKVYRLQSAAEVLAHV